MNYSLHKSSNEILFGDLTQCKLIMEKNFEGKQFVIESLNKPKIDCMFFPATTKEVVELDPIVSKKYLDKSTIVICNPNAVIY
jgi:hypothetical protein